MYSRLWRVIVSSTCPGRYNEYNYALGCKKSQNIQTHIHVLGLKIVEYYIRQCFGGYDIEILLILLIFLIIFQKYTISAKRKDKKIQKKHLPKICNIEKL